MAHPRTPGRFNGFPQGAFDFFEQLALHNNRDWFHSRQEGYQRACREPMTRRKRYQVDTHERLYLRHAGTPPPILASSCYA
jgi:uncharacterized protein (DUF2461 family)